MLMPFELKLPNLAITDVSIAAVDRPPLALWITYRVVVLSWSIFALRTALLALLTYIRINVTPRSSFYAPAYRCRSPRILVSFSKVTKLFV